MQLYILYFLILLGGLRLGAQSQRDDVIYLADPTVFEDEGIYYLYGTKGDNTIKGSGFLVYTSKDLKHWEGPVGSSDGFALKKGDAYGNKGFWAPQIFKHKAKYYMAYTANENIAIATSDSPLGPFVNDNKALEAPVRQIDPYVFFDEDKVYLYHVRLQEGNRIFVAEMNADLKSIKPETLRECINAEETWENTANADWPVAEGPTVFKKDALYYLLYSANDYRNPDYAVGYAISRTPLGPWEKMKTNPLISKLDSRAGTGHGDLFYDKRGRMKYVLHTHLSNEEVGPRKTAILELSLKNQKLSVKNNSFYFVEKQ